VRMAAVADEVPGSSVGVAHEAEAAARSAELLFAPRACNGSDTRLRALLADGRVAAPRDHRRFHPLGFDAWDVKVRSEFMATPLGLGAAVLDHFCHRGTGSHHSVAAGTVAFSAHACARKPGVAGAVATGPVGQLQWHGRLLVHHAPQENVWSRAGAIPSGM
jgi:hypothetical protein